jgi:hypothetical protein
VQLSSIFGQGRSDYVNFLGASVPSVFFTDANGACYHTVNDEIDIVDFDKLQQQIAISLGVTRALANVASPPAFVPGTPLATYDDAVEAAGVVERAWADRGRFSQSDQDLLAAIRTDMQRIVADGRAEFGNDDIGTLLGRAQSFVSLLTRSGPCTGFLSSQPRRAGTQN